MAETREVVIPVRLDVDALRRQAEALDQAGALLRQAARAMRDAADIDTDPPSPPPNPVRGETPFTYRRGRR